MLRIIAYAAAILGVLVTSTMAQGLDELNPDVV